MTCKPGIPSSHSCDLSDNHGDAHHCPACGRAWVLSGTCRAAETTPGPSAVQSPQTAPRDGSAEATGPLAAHLPAIRDALSIAISEAQYAATEKPYREAQDALDGLEAEVRAKLTAVEAKAAAWATLGFGGHGFSFGDTYLADCGRDILAIIRSDEGNGNGA